MQVKRLQKSTWHFFKLCIPKDRLFHDTKLETIELLNFGK